LIPGKGDTRFFSKVNLSTQRSLKYIGCIPLTSGPHIIHYQNADSN